MTSKNPPKQRRQRGELMAQVSELMSAGHGTCEIARRLGLSTGNISTAISRLFDATAATTLRREVARPRYQKFAARILADLGRGAPIARVEAKYNVRLDKLLERARKGEIHLPELVQAAAGRRPGRARRTTVR